ncbi:MAG: hypothetical protein V1740_05790 [Candidatus Woesearchaeota archaeon]
MHNTNKHNSYSCVEITTQDLLDRFQFRLERERAYTWAIADFINGIIGLRAFLGYQEENIASNDQDPFVNIIAVPKAYLRIPTLPVTRRDGIKYEPEYQGIEIIPPDHIYIEAILKMPDPLIKFRRQLEAATCTNNDIFRLGAKELGIKWEHQMQTTYEGDPVTIYRISARDHSNEVSSFISLQLLTREAFEGLFAIDINPNPLEFPSNLTQPELIHQY